MAPGHLCGPLCAGFVRKGAGQGGGGKRVVAGAPRPRYHGPCPSTPQRSAPSRAWAKAGRRGARGQGGEAIRPHRSMTAPLRDRRRDRDGRRPPRAGSTVRSRRPSPARSRPFGSTARLPRQHGRRRSRRTGPPAPVTGCLRTRRDRPNRVPNAMAKRAPAGNHPATTSPEDCPSGRRRETLPCASTLSGLLGTTTSLPASGSTISSTTPFSTVNRSARTAASVPCNASRLPAATTAARPISAASVRADSVSALESRRVSPPEASWRAMTDPIPPVPMTAVVMTETPHRHSTDNGGPEHRRPERSRSGSLRGGTAGGAASSEMAGRDLSVRGTGRRRCEGSRR